MTTINTSDDLLRLLREDSTFYAEARRLVLSDELLALPERFAALANRVDGFIEEQRAVNERVDGFIEEQKATNEEQRAFNQRVDEFIEEQRATNRRLETAIGELRGDQAYRACRERADEIAEELGFTVIDIISGLQRRELFRSNPPPNFTPGDRRSFYYADLIMQVRDQQGNPAYLAVEASYTADERDTQRTLRNAQYLRHITGLPAYAAIASRQNDRAIQELPDGGSILWYQLPDEAFKPE